jgi:hypothetical protein
MYLFYKPAAARGHVISYIIKQINNAKIFIIVVGAVEAGEIFFFEQSCVFWL